MTTSWVAVLFIAGAVGLVATPIARNLALAHGMVDRPGPGKGHRRVTPYLGGVAIAVAVLVGQLVGRGSALGAVVIACASVLVVVGLMDDVRPVGPWIRVMIEVAVASMVVVAGVRFAGIGTTALDAVIAVALLVLVTNSVNLLDNLDGLSSGVTAAGAAGVLAMAISLGHRATTVTSASLLGTCLAFLAFNAKPASIFMGDAGSLFLGFLLAATAIETGSFLSGPSRVIFPLLILGLPLTDTATVVVARLRNRRQVMSGGRDHISHRLAKAGLGSAKAVALLIGVEAVMATLAVLAGRGRIAWWLALASGAALLLTLVGVAGRVRVYRTHAPGLPGVAFWTAAGLVALALLLAVPTVAAALKARAPALQGESAAQQALSAARDGHLTQAAADFAVAKTQFSRAQHDLESPLTSIGLAYPIISTNLRAARTLADVGAGLATLGHQLALASDRFRYDVRGGTVPVTELAATAPEFRAAVGAVQSADTRVSGTSRALLLPPLSNALARLEHQLVPARHDVEQAFGIATSVPDLFGLEGPRQYFLAFQDNAEARATGGLIGLYGMLVVTQGHTQLTDVNSAKQLNNPGGQYRTLQAPSDYLARYRSFDPADNWQNVNLSPDFPTVGSVITSLYPESGGQHVDGVLAVDPEGLAALLKLTGPVTVGDWPVPITSANVVEITLHQSYGAYTSDNVRQVFLKHLVRSVFDAVSNLSVSDPKSLVDDLEPAVKGRHIQIFSSSPTEEAYLSSLHMSGAMPPIRSDSLMFTTQNAAGNKTDYYMHRSLDYQLSLDPDAAVGGEVTSARVSGEVTVSLDNTAPSAGQPSEVIGPYGSAFAAGENRSYVALYSPLGITSATWNSKPAVINSTHELGRTVSSTFVEVPPGSARIFGAHLVGDVRLLSGGWYELDIPVQPLVNPDHEQATITLAPGWRVTEAKGATVVGPSEVRADFTTASEQVVRVHLAPGG